MKKNIVLGLVVAANLMWVAGCSSIVNGKSDQSEKIHIKEDKVKQLDITLNIGAGQLNVSEGTKEWVEGEIDYNIDDLEPKVKYKRSGQNGKLVIEQSKKNFSGIKMGDIKNDWDLQLSNKVPIDLSVNSGASETKLDLQGLQLSSLDIDAGVGDITVDLSGDWKESFDVDLEMGVGQSTIILPKDVGVKIKSSKGIGHTDFKGFISEGNGVYVNEAYKNADVKIEVNTELGIGEANFVLEK
ncbi:toast rack family protein [Bacillus sp. CGMCC 1.16607]|uniref:toast rack family protein n=1 Tax=Bacillus sp. CGMCC 1.16607 TaxID=3351842 RepID=UPI003638C747